jgi:hypothetical protein
MIKIVVDAFKVDFDELNLEIFLAFSQNLSSRRNIDCMAKRCSLSIVASLLSSRDDVGLILDGKRSIENLPMRLSSGHRKRRRVSDDLSSLQLFKYNLPPLKQVCCPTCSVFGFITCRKAASRMVSSGLISSRNCG